MSNKSLRIQAYNWLKKKIITLEYPMGSTLVESALCLELRMGRTPVREALQQLASEGLVSIRPRKGTFVSNINFWDFENLLEVRIMLETQVVRKLAGKISPDQVNNLQILFEDVPALIKQRDLDGLLAIDRKFHQGLVNLVDNPYLNDMADHIYDLVARTWYLSFRNRSQTDLALTLQDHLDILKQLEQGDAEAAEKAVRDHVMNFRNKVFHQPQA
jgi:GntR family transcriptional regulator, rspAB operon transcriptional repressor